MDRRQDVRLYNLLLPIWMLVFFPSWLWLLLIPANYLLDRVVLRWSLGDLPEKGLFCRKHTWKICLIGFLADFLGVVLLFAVLLLDAGVEAGHPFLEALVYGVGYNPFSNPAAFLVTALGVALAGLVIYRLDRRILRRAGLEEARAEHSARMMALITAPYFFLFPSALIYQSGLFQF